MPPYDEALKDSELVVRKLGSPARSFSAYLRGYETRVGYYLPPRDPAFFREGFWIARENGELRVRCVVLDTVSLTYGFAQNSQWSSPERYGDSVIVLPAAANSSVLFVVATELGGINPLTRDSYGNLSFGTNYAVPNQVGVGVSPLSALVDRFCAASVPAGVFSLTHSNAGSSAAFSGPLWITPGYSASAPASPAFAALSLGSNLYLSATLADGSLATFKWGAGAWASEPTRLDFIDKKVNGILSDDRLFANGEDALSVYDSAAKTSFTITTGKLRFLYERYDSTSAAWVCVFSRTTVVSNSKSDEKSEHRIEIYEIPTANLSKIAD